MKPGKVFLTTALGAILVGTTCAVPAVLLTKKNEQRVEQATFVEEIKTTPLTLAYAQEAQKATTKVSALNVADFSLNVQTEGQTTPIPFVLKNPAVTTTYKIISSNTDMIQGIAVVQVTFTKNTSTTVRTFTMSGFLKEATQDETVAKLISDELLSIGSAKLIAQKNTADYLPSEIKPADIQLLNLKGSPYQQKDQFVYDLNLIPDDQKGTLKVEVSIALKNTNDTSKRVLPTPITNLMTLETHNKIATLNSLLDTFASVTWTKSGATAPTQSVFLPSEIATQAQTEEFTFYRDSTHTEATKITLPDGVKVIITTKTPFDRDGNLELTLTLKENELSSKSKTIVLKNCLNLPQSYLKKDLERIAAVIYTKNKQLLPSELNLTFADLTLNAGEFVPFSQYTYTLINVKKDDRGATPSEQSTQTGTYSFQIQAQDANGETFSSQVYTLDGFYTTSYVQTQREELDNLLAKAYYADHLHFDGETTTPENKSELFPSAVIAQANFDQGVVLYARSGETLDFGTGKVIKVLRKTANDMSGKIELELALYDSATNITSTARQFTITGYKHN
ncbi:lipoprotein 17-related variable surface protein [Mycoplasmopsis columbinasalis]|uniref:Lipoprotein associated domain n=1 Tax=Mycoplasmopsis columbinasalis TaxID=114880 RepID=A0A449BBF2_9BACT|nr:lipoprotein 17-related variable surface protein [Mycoplasmopsis columbinasalis]VEU78372.1 Lipoprotein associated domain [Mycoplasmopsis columbinasalis]